MPMQSVLFSYSGRINRFEFWIKGVVAGLIVVALLELVANLLASYVSYTLGSLFSLAVWIPYWWMLFAIVAKRCHDRGGSGWWGLLTLIPFIGILYFVIACGIMSGDPL